MGNQPKEEKYYKEYRIEWKTCPIKFIVIN